MFFVVFFFEWVVLFVDLFFVVLVDFFLVSLCFFCYIDSDAMCVTCGVFGIFVKRLYCVFHFCLMFLVCV